MKKILLGLIMLATAAVTNAQLRLENIIEDFQFLTNQNIDGDAGGNSLDNGYIGNDLLMMRDQNTGELCFYDADGDLCKRLKAIPSRWSTEDGYFYEVIYIARNIFTTDGQVCRLVRKCKKGEDVFDGPPSDYFLGISIIGENGNVIQEISNNVTYYPILIKVSNKYKLLFNDCEGVGSSSESASGYDHYRYSVYVYSCPGNGSNDSTSVQNVPAKVKRNAFPNPATDVVTLPYDANGATSMKIYDMQGKLVERKFLDKNKQELQLNVKNYTSGMYFFEVNGESNSFIVE